MNQALPSKHAHNFHSHSQQSAQKVTIVFSLTVITMVVEITAGLWSGSMALLADGWHMGTHAAAFAIAMFAYHYAHSRKDDASFTFGTGKVQSLSGFASAIALLVIALLMAVESIERLVNPQAIRFSEAIVVAIVGLVVNVASVFILHNDQHHSHGDHHDHDHNLKAAYFHVLADALTSILAIVALCAGRAFGWVWMDAVMGIVGALIITNWAYGLIVENARILLDRCDVDVPALTKVLEHTYSLTVNDIHIWSISENHRAIILSVDTDKYVTPVELKAFLKGEVPRLVHATVEVTGAETVDGAL